MYICDPGAAATSLPTNTDSKAGNNGSSNEISFVAKVCTRFAMIQKTYSLVVAPVYVVSKLSLIAWLLTGITRACMVSMNPAEDTKRTLCSAVLVLVQFSSRHTRASHLNQRCWI